MRFYRSRNRERLNLYKRDWARNKRKSKSLQKPKKKSSYKPKEVSKEMILRRLKPKIFQRDNFTCRYCGIKTHLVIDHIKPFRGGGSYLDENNLITSCLRCNSFKNDKELSAWLELEKRRLAEVQSLLNDIPLIRERIKRIPLIISNRNSQDETIKVSN